MSILNFGRLLRRANLHSDKPAITDLSNGWSINHGAHAERVAALAKGIASLDVRPSDRVAVLAEAGHVYIELWHAGLAGGFVICPLNARFALDEMIFVLNDSEAKILVVDSTHAATIINISDKLKSVEQIVLIDPADIAQSVLLEDLVTAGSGAALPNEPGEDSMAALVYTGGTTGLPKGVVHSQRSLTATIFRMQRNYGARSGQKYLSVMPMFHIGSIGSWGAFLPSGNHIVIQPGFDPNLVNHIIVEHKITAFGAVPTMFAMMLENPEYQSGMLSSIDLLLYGGAPMWPALLELLMKEMPDVRFINNYGMTETAGTSTVLMPEHHRLDSKKLASVGQPDLGVQIDIRDPKTGQPLPQGETGEIWINSDAVMTEYWKRPKQTADSVKNGWYRTGDAGSLDADGFLFMADRVKDMIISGGENIYGLEVENAISAHPAVQQAAVIGRPHPLWGEMVHAFVVCAPGSVTLDELTEHVRHKIADYKVPKEWTFQSDPLPLSAVGKVAKIELRDQLSEAADKKKEEDQ